MAEIAKVITGLVILAKYNDQGQTAHLQGAEHDIIYGPSLDENAQMSAQDHQALQEAGWHWDEEWESWAHFA